jgi:hypothetical protein
VPTDLLMAVIMAALAVLSFAYVVGCEKLL